MKNLILLLISLFFIQNNIAQKEVELTNDGIILPRLTNSQRNSLHPVEGQVIYNLTSERVNIYDGVGWQDHTGASTWVKIGNRIYYNAGRVGIKVSNPKTTFHIADGKRVLWGTDTLGKGDKLMWLPDLHAFRVGTVATGAASTYWNRDSIGLYSFASGYNTRAQGFGATATGRDTEATNSYAFASGFFSNADGLYSTAMGFNTDAFATGSTALGYSTDAEANYSLAAGYFAEAQAIYSIALGHSVRAQSYASMAVGRFNVGGGSRTSWLSSDPIFEIGIGTGPSTRANAMTVRKNGNVGIGTTAPGARLHVANGVLRVGSLEEIADGGSFLFEFNSTLVPSTNGNRNLGNSTNRWSTVYATNGTINTSDARLKKNIKVIPYGIQDIMALNPVIFHWKAGQNEKPKLGLIAQEVRPLINEVVSEYEYEQSEITGNWEKKEVEYLGINYADLIPVLIKGMQDQQQLIKQLQSSLVDQQEEINALKAMK